MSQRDSGLPSLRPVPNTTAALAAGAISARHAAVIADAVVDAPARAVALIEPEAVATAVEGDVRATARLMRAFQHALDPDSADERALERYERAGITFSPLLDGGFAIAGTADETTGAALVAAMTAAAPLVKGDTRTASRRRLDGLHRIATHWLDFSNPDPDVTARRTSKSKARLIVTIDQQGLAGGTSPGGTLTWAGPVTAATAQRLGCASTATFDTLDGEGNVVDAGSQRRFFAQNQLLAMVARDGDQCCAPYRREDHDRQRPLPCEAHHLQLHEATGPCTFSPTAATRCNAPTAAPSDRTTPARPQPTTTPTRRRLTWGGDG